MTTMLATVDTTGAISGTPFIAVDETRDEQVVDSPWSKDLTAEEIEDGEWDAILTAAGWTVTGDWEDHDGYWTAEVEEARYYADVTTGAQLSVHAAATDQRLISFKGYDGYDFNWSDPDPDSDEQRRATTREALAEIGWEPIPGEEWVDIEGGLPYRDGAVRVPVRRIAGR